MASTWRPFVSNIYSVEFCPRLLQDVDVEDFNVIFRFFLMRPDAFDFLYDIKALSGSSKYGMLTI